MAHHVFQFYSSSFIFNDCTVSFNSIIFCGKVCLPIKKHKKKLLSWQFDLASNFFFFLNGPCSARSLFISFRFFLIILVLQSLVWIKKKFSIRAQLIQYDDNNHLFIGLADQ